VGGSEVSILECVEEEEEDDDDDDDGSKGVSGSNAQKSQLRYSLV